MVFAAIEPTAIATITSSISYFCQNEKALKNDITSAHGETQRRASCWFDYSPLLWTSHFSFCLNKRINQLLINIHMQGC